MDPSATAENSTMGDPPYASSLSRDASSCASSNSRSNAREPPVFKFDDVTCVICLDNVKNRAFVNSCSHAFCLGCLLKWTKQKLECPLCIRPFSVVYYSVRSPDVYKRIPLRCLKEPSDRHCCGEFGFYNSQFGRIKKMFDYGILLTQDDEHLPINIYPALRRDVYSFRKTVYEKNYWSVGERYPNEWLDPEFYTENPDFLVHLFPWLYRELEVLLREQDDLIDEAFDLIVSTMQIYEVYSSKCVNNLKPFLGDQTHHFLHELINFIFSRQSMPAYDRRVKYCTVNFLRDNDIRSAIVNGPGENDSITLDEGSQIKISTGTVKRHIEETIFPTTSFADIVAITPGRHEQYRYYAVVGGVEQTETRAAQVKQTETRAAQVKQTETRAAQVKQTETRAAQAKPEPVITTWEARNFVMDFQASCPAELIMEAIMSAKRQRR